jgi:hypothetical protein
MVVKPGIAIVALPASGRGRNGPLFCRCSDRELRSRPASKGAVRRHPGRALALRLQRQRTLRGRSAVRPAASKKSRDPLLPRRAGRSTALFAQPSLSDSTVIARTSRRCRIVRRAAASLRLPPRRPTRSVSTPPDTGESWPSQALRRVSIRTPPCGRLRASGSVGTGELGRG